MVIVIMIKPMNNYFTKSKIYICLVLIILSAVILPVKVLAFDKDFFSGNDILFYDPTCADNTIPGDGDGNLTGKNNREKIWCYLTTSGFSKGGAAGVIGNMARESSWTPNKWQGGGFCDGDKKFNLDCGYGLLQWSDLGLKKDLWKSVNETFPDDTGKVGTLKVQLDFMIHSFKTDTDSDVGDKLINLLKNDSTTPEEAAWQILNLYNCRPQYCGGSSIICQECSLNVDTSEPEAIKAYKDFKDLNCGGANPPSATTSASGAKPKILIGPGHTGNMVPTTEYNGNPKIMDRIYANKPELQDVWDVAQIVKPALEEKGYEVLMTKNSVDGKPYSWDRAKQANDNKVDLAFEIHTSSPSGTFGNWGQTWSQYKGGYRVDRNGNNFDLVASDSVIEKSKEYAANFTTARKAAGEPNVVSMTNPGFYNASNPPGNMTLVQLWSEVPWVYLEAGANPSKDGDNSGGITDAQKEIYAKGIINGVVASVPPGSGTAANDCEGGSGGNGGASDIVAQALKFAWDTAHVPEGEPRPEYQTWINDVKHGSWDVTDCGRFVSATMQASGADPKYPDVTVSAQEPYIKDNISNGKYKSIENKGSTEGLEPGDLVLYYYACGGAYGYCGHTYLFVGDTGAGPNARSASLGTRAPSGASAFYPVYTNGAHSANYKIYRKL